MGSFKDVAYEILKEANASFHSNEITRIALDKGWLKTSGKTPEATMNAVLITDINSKGEHSRFVKTAPSTFGLNPKKPRKREKSYVVSPNLSTIQKGNIVEARVAELISLYGSKSLSCYKPICDDDGIDLIVKEKGSFKTIYLQIKSRFSKKPGKVYSSRPKTRVKRNKVPDVYMLVFVFCLFDSEEGDLWDSIWFVPSYDLLKIASCEKTNENLTFTAGSDKWASYLIDKRDIADAILKQMSRL